MEDELNIPSKDLLMQRQRDFADSIEKEIHYYNDVILKPLEVRNDTFSHLRSIKIESFGSTSHKY